MENKLKEIKELLKLNYEEICKYLQKKYGIPKKDYFVNENCKTKSKNITKTKDGLFIHHWDENKAILLANPKYAIQNPFSFQKKERLIYCDLLEHLLLHIKIFEFPHKNKIKDCLVGINGATVFIIPQLNDFYSGFKTKQKWMIPCIEKVINHKDCYFELIKHFNKLYIPYSHRNIYSSYSNYFDNWELKNNLKIFKELEQIWKYKIKNFYNFKKKLNLNMKI